ncbi:hypothetical protein ZYGR_0S02410 [Zygosaccharomyces rouxii]|uniref:ZYRO0F07898p n=2 Tax=Zygosaccharomyces rouxii TaxID=4956 RepID=C5DXU6_ZYGRC|nr:uncharacterized protein ZYRO0F07898g [Zygosaccharomyces rouxii]KAH9199365.1 hypothetical protein LQ764DRAFT_129382 [Zygosaccharomyces rouxii]GAV50107.1 hypothetical protein ZYGR_0S02410 [Zygosaccharomyces rouxii]CAR28607.1 ZYRO0F07898p [Zygosaccharomyces rouxii]
MLYCVWVILLYWRLIAPVVGLDNGDADTLNFKVEPVKYSNYDSTYDRFCFTMELSPTEELTSNVLFTFYVLDVLPFATDAGRFGGTSKSRGRQALHMSIKDPISGNLLRSTRNLKSGVTHVELNAGDSHKLDVCLANLVYDSSWSSLDIWEFVAVQLKTKEQLAWSKLGSLQEEYQVQQDVDNCMNKISHTINGEIFQELRSTETEHRNINESLCNAFVITLIVMIAFISSPPVILAYYCIKYKGFPGVRSPRA